MRTDKDLFDALETAHPGLFAAVSPNVSTGNFLTKPPRDLGLVWHHLPVQTSPSGYTPPEGIMQLISRYHHQGPNPVANTLHPFPNNGGGYQQWG